MDYEEGALMEPLAVGVHACKRANIQIGDIALVMGAGPIGLVSMLAARAMGASKICIAGKKIVVLETHLSYFVLLLFSRRSRCQA